MASSLNLGDLPSWITMLLIGLGILVATSNGVLGAEYESWGRIINVGFGLVGAFHVFTDIGRKI